MERGAGYIGGDGKVAALESKDASRMLALHEQSSVTLKVYVLGSRVLRLT